MAERRNLDVGRALVIGLGRSGQAAATALRSAGVEVVAADQRPDLPGDLLGALEDARVEVHLDDPEPFRHLDRVDLVVPSPGVVERAPVLLGAQRRGIAVWSEPELGWRLRPRRVVAVTGTNGKTTVTELVAAMLEASGLPASACGNIGWPFTTAALEAPHDTLLVAELSSFQLRFCHQLRPAVGALLNLAPDHLDWHGDLTAYGAAKARLWRAQTAQEWAVGNLDEPASAALLRRSARGRRAWFSATRNVPQDLVGVGVSGSRLIARVAGDERDIVGIDDLPVTAPHHVANVAAAACVSMLAGAETSAIGRAAAEFHPGRHRVEQVASGCGLRFVDDSKATNPHAAAAALTAFDSVVWIAGGLAKGVDLGGLAAHLGAVRHAVLIGEAAEDLGRVCNRAGVSNEGAVSVETAVRAAAAAARHGDVVLLAPACASFDQFADYAERGERFAAAARAWTEECRRA